MAADSTRTRGRVRVPKTAELVADSIRRQIASGALTSGDALPSESTLMDEFNISRPTLREAFRILESENLISVRRGARGGARVQLPDHDVAARYTGLILQYNGVTLDDVFEARTLVEVPAAHTLAARSDRKASAAKLRAVLEEESGEVSTPAHSTAFHRLLVELTENEALVLVTGMLEMITEAAGQSLAGENGSDEQQSRRSHLAHRKLIDLIAAGDAVRAEAHWRRHLVEGGKYLIGAVGGDVLDVLQTETIS